MAFQAILFTLIILISIFFTKSIGQVPAVKNEAQLNQTATAEISPVIAQETVASENQPNPAPVVLPKNSLIISSSSELSQSQTSQTNVCENIGPGSLTGRTALLKYVNSGFNIFEKNPENRWPIASISKLMTAVVASEEIDPEKEITLSQNAGSIDGIANDFKTGETFKAKDLIKAMLVISSNRAATALAESMNQKDFVAEMQKKAEILGMTQTNYTEPTGLSYLNQSTASDLSRLAEYIYSVHPEIFQLSRQKQAKILELKSRKYQNLVNIDEFSGDPDFIGGKTGYIDAAGRNLLALFIIKGQPVLTVVLGSDDAFSDTRILKNYLESCR